MGWGSKIDEYLQRRRTQALTDGEKYDVFVRGFLRALLTAVMIIPLATFESVAFGTDYMMILSLPIILIAALVYAYQFVRVHLRRLRNSGE